MEHKKWETHEYKYYKGMCGKPTPLGVGWIALDK